MLNKKLLIGSHVSIAGGLDKAFEQAKNIDATCIQIFTKNQRQWTSKPLDQQTIQNFIAAKKKSSVKVLVAHASYLINLAANSKDSSQKSLDALIDELERCESLQIQYLVIHPGTSQNDDTHQGLLNIAHQINNAFKKVPFKYTKLLLETMAGQGRSLGKTFEELAFILQHIVPKKRVGICVDTCHIFAAGYEFQTEKSYNDMWQNFDKIIGIKYIKVFHINNSKKECGSKVDRHEHLDQGKISATAFKSIMQDKKFKNIPKILETPKENNATTSDIKNLNFLKKYT